MPPWLETPRDRGAAWDLHWARTLHRASARPRLQRMLVACSRLGEAPLWVGASVLLLLAGSIVGWRLGALALALGGTNLALYWTLKLSTRRERPFRRCTDIRECVRANDAFSFPSGHTLHAVAYAVLLSMAWPALTPLLAGFAGLVAVSRVVLGVHFPSDVLVGGLIGAATGATAAALL